jgi:hypothetical protein
VANLHLSERVVAVLKRPQREISGRGCFAFAKRVLVVFSLIERFRTLGVTYTQLIPKLFFKCSVEEDGVVDSAGISGQDKGILDESATVDSPEPLEVLNLVLS